MDKAEYTECYIAFLDMLGFKNLISHGSCDEIAGIYAKFYNKKPMQAVYLGDRNIISENTTEKLNMKVMSDSICFYIDVNEPDALLCIIMSCIMFQYTLYQNDPPIFLRGAIVRGNLYVNQDITFGPGLTQAYLLEENNAKYPRIILTKEILKFIDENSEKNDIDYASILKLIVFRDDDAFYAVDNAKLLMSGDKAIREKVKRKIKYMLDTTIDNSIREKYLYLERRL